MTMKYQTKSMNVADIKVRIEDNVRLSAAFTVAGQHVDTYDLPTLMENIIARGAITEPLKVDGDGYVLQGFRRALSGKELQLNPAKYVSDPAKQAELLESLKKVPVMMYSSLTSDERLELINDHGDRKGIGRTEFVRTVWNLYLKGYPEAQISNLLTYAAAEFTNKLRMLTKLPPIGSPERAARIKKWFHGTIGNKILSVFHMGPALQDDYLLTLMWEDGLLKDEKDEDGNVTVKAKRPRFTVKTVRITELSKAITQDKEAGVWDSDKKSGPAFDGLIAKFIQQDETGEKPESTDTRKTMTELTKLSESYLSKAFQSAMKIASGVKVENAVDLDKSAARAESVFAILDKHVENIANPELKDFIVRILHADVADLEQFLLAACEVVKETVPNGATVS